MRMRSLSIYYHEFLNLWYQTWLQSTEGTGAEPAASIWIREREDVGVGGGGYSAREGRGVAEDVTSKGQRRGMRKEIFIHPHLQPWPVGSATCWPHCDTPKRFHALDSSSWHWCQQEPGAADWAPKTQPDPCPFFLQPGQLTVLLGLLPVCAQQSSEHSGHQHLYCQSLLVSAPILCIAWKANDKHTDSKVFLFHLYCLLTCSICSNYIWGTA